MRLLARLLRGDDGAMVAIAQRARRDSARDALGPWALDVVHNVDCERGLRALPDDCLDVIVTSPPYWGQRGAGGLGSEADPRDYVARLTALLAEAMRCLKPSGTLWLNVGDAYNTPINWREADHVYSSLGADGVGLPATNSAYTKNRGRRRAFVRGEVGWLRYGNLLAIPYRIVTAMCDRGFLFRGEVIWEKSRPMPEGLCRRPHRRHEGIYVFAKDERHAFQTRPPVGSVWKLRQTPNLTPHSSTFPLDLPMQCIRAAGAPGSPGDVVVCDPFMGSGTTGRAARALGHRFVGFELDPDICRIANDHVREGSAAREHDESAHEPSAARGRSEVGARTVRRSQAQQSRRTNRPPFAGAVESAHEPSAVRRRSRVGARTVRRESAHEPSAVRGAVRSAHEPSAAREHDESAREPSAARGRSEGGARMARRSRAR